MAAEYSVEVCRGLEERFGALGLHRPMRISRYEADAELSYDVTTVAQATQARVSLAVEKFVGGGFAGQVYRVKVLDIQGLAPASATLGAGAEGEPIEGLEVGGVYAMKILIPPSGLSRLFRNFLYWVGFQGPFQLQVNPAAARAGALWQKFIRRAAKVRFGDENAVVDIHATFVDRNLGSCGELSEWVEGRTWQLEVDDRMDLLKRWVRGKAIDEAAIGGLGSPEYRAKRTFMREFVELLYDIGAYEFARQYEWSTCKSQPNCLKRTGAPATKPEDDSQGGLVAVDFRAGLALLPFLPMSPGDFKLIAKGLKRSSLVQFDRGNIEELEAFVQAHSEKFADMQAMLEELKDAECIYRNSTPDITHNHFRLLYSPNLWTTMLNSAVTGWRVRNLTDQEHEPKLRSSKCRTLLFFTIGLIPFLGKCLRRIWGRADWRKHYACVLTSFDYLSRAIRARVIERTIDWHRKGRISAERAQKFAEQPWRYFCHLPFVLLIFPGLHRFFTDWKFAKEKLAYIFVRPFKLYFSRKLREQWLRDMVQEGKKKHILTDEDAETIISHLSEPYVQRYLISLVVHLLTLPITQIVSFIAAWIYWKRTGDEIGAGGIVVLFQIIPISPGSIARGLYAVAIAIYDRSFKNYNIAVFLSFFKYIGYLAFPIQMTYHYPVLARFMAGHWATEAVHIVPVFGERGALLEHWVFRLFYNWPLTIRRRMRKRAEMRASMKPRYWHAALCAVVVGGWLALGDFFHLSHTGTLPALKDIWWLVAALPLVCGAVVTLGCGGAPLWKRILAATFSGIAAVVVGTVIVGALQPETVQIAFKTLAKACGWRTFVFAIVATIGAAVTEAMLGDPDLK